MCSPGQELEYQVAHHDTANITCKVDAVPDNVTFTWRFNSSGSLLELGEGRAASWGTTSVLPYTPASPGDYGLLLCTAKNAIGTQHMPCVINVTAASEFPQHIDKLDRRSCFSFVNLMICSPVYACCPLPTLHKLLVSQKICMYTFLFHPPRLHLPSTHYYLYVR